MADDAQQIEPTLSYSRYRVFAAVATTLAVFMLALCVRLPACAESFWLDELHSAWTVWGTWEDVAPRAIAGNQTPTYFWLLWCWKQCVGDAEWLLRLPSVIASAGVAALITWQLSRAYQQTLLGLFIGTAFAIESNAVFFGTELRPFAVVMWLSTIACVLLTSPRLSRQQRLLGLAGVMLTSAAFQPMSLGVFGPLLIVAYVFLPRTEPQSLPQAATIATLRFHWLAALAWIGLVLVVVIVSWQSWTVLRPAWLNRQQWATFASGASWRTWWTAWPWSALVIAPLGALGSVQIALRLRQSRASLPNRVASQAGLPWWSFTLAGVLSVLLFWLLTVTHLAPVFHRRYFVASLPLLMFGAGAIIARGLELMRRYFPESSMRLVRGLFRTSGCLPLVLLLLTQNVGAKLAQGDWVTVRRGEGWREAAAAITRSPQAVPVFLHTGLVEAPRLLSAAARGELSESVVQAYLTFPLRGSYQVPNVKAVDRPPQMMANAPFQLVLRGNRAQAKAWADRIRPQGTGLSIRSFGQVCVIENSSQ